MPCQGVKEHAESRPTINVNDATVIVPSIWDSVALLADGGGLVMGNALSSGESHSHLDVESALKLHERFGESSLALAWDPYFNAYDVNAK